MSQQIHAHDVLAIIHAADGAFSASTLVWKLVETYGEDARFCSCSCENMDANEIINFLFAKEKVIVREGCLYLRRNDPCEHGLVSE